MKEILGSEAGHKSIYMDVLDVLDS